MSYKEWHHGYLGILILALGLTLLFISVWEGLFLTFLGSILTIFGMIIYIDDLVQHIKQKTNPTYQSPLHILYSTLYSKFEWIRKLNEFLDHLFGKG